MASDAGKGNIQYPYSLGSIGSTTFGDGQLVAVVGSGTGYVEAGAGWGYWALIQGANRSVETTFNVPPDFSTGSNVYIDVFWKPSTGTVGEIIKFELGVSRQQIGFARAADTVYAQDVAVPNDNFWHVVTTTIAAAPWVPGDLIHFRIRRRGDLAADTYSWTMVVTAAEVRY